GTQAHYDRASHINKRIWRALIDAYGWTDPFWDLLTLECFSRAFLETEEADERIALLKQSFISDAPPELFAALSEAVETADLRPILGQIAAPTLIMVGEYDILTPIEMGPEGAGARVLHESIPTSELAVMKGCGHINLFERPQESADIISRFLRDV